MHLFACLCRHQVYLFSGALSWLWGAPIWCTLRPRGDERSWLQWRHHGILRRRPLDTFFRPQVKRRAGMAHQGWNSWRGGKRALEKPLFVPSGSSVTSKTRFFSPCFALNTRQSDLGVRCQGERRAQAKVALG